jgi:GNAT superfamily N-acetyltransferase
MSIIPHYRSERGAAKRDIETCDNYRMAEDNRDKLRIVPATEHDIAVILGFIRKLAEYENLSHQVEASEALLRDTLFGTRRVAEVLIAYAGNEPAGFALYFHNFSTFLGRPGIYLEDLFVEPVHRGEGIGKALLIEIAKIAKKRDCGRLEWAVLDWNRPAIEFYRRLGAVPLNDWRLFRVTGQTLENLATEKPPQSASAD